MDFHLRPKMKEVSCETHVVHKEKEFEKGCEGRRFVKRARRLRGVILAAQRLKFYYVIFRVCRRIMTKHLRTLLSLEAGIISLSQQSRLKPPPQHMNNTIIYV